MELHCVMIWCLYHRDICMCEIRAIICKKCGWNVEIELQEQFWNFQKVWCPLKRGNGCSSGKNVLPVLFADLVSARAGYFTLERGSFVDRPSTRALYLTLERIFHATSTFAGLKGPLERGSPRSSRDSIFWKFENAFYVLFSVPFHF